MFVLPVSCSCWGVAWPDQGRVSHAGWESERWRFQPFSHLCPPHLASPVLVLSSLGSREMKGKVHSVL